jgi:thymidylate synthase (FAD)
MPIEDNQAASNKYLECLARAENLYSELLSMNVAPEQARMVLPQSMMTSYYVTGSLAAFARAYKLRIDAHAQVEIQLLAKQWNDIIAPLFPVSWKALTETYI